MDRMPEVGDVIRFNGFYEDDTWSVTKVHSGRFDGCYVGKNPELIRVYGRVLVEDLNGNLSKWEYVEDEFVRYVRNVRERAGIIDDWP